MTYISITISISSWTLPETHQMYAYIYICIDTSLITTWNSQLRGLPMKVCRRSSKAIMSRFDPQVLMRRVYLLTPRDSPQEMARGSTSGSQRSYPPWNMNDWNPQKMEVWKRIVLFNWVMLKFQPFIFMDVGCFAGVH